MAYPVYYVVEGDTLPHLFDTFDGGTGASITMTGLAVTDIEIYKDGGTTQRSSDAGYTLLDTDGIDFDGITGIHGFSIDLNDNTDAGFYTVGPWYHVVISTITVDAQTVSFVACAFRIVSATRGLAGTALPAAAADAAGGLPISDAGGLDMDDLKADVTAILADTGTDGVVLAADAITAAKIADDAISSEHLATGALTADAFAADSIVAATIKADAVTKIQNGLATPTNITAGTITTVTNLTNAPTNGDLTATMKTSVTTACTASTPTAAAVTGAVGSVTAGVTLANGAHGGAAATLTLGGAGGLTGDVTGNLSGSVGSVTGAVGSVTGAVGSVTGAVGSVTGNVGGNVAGSVGSVTGAVGSVTGNVGGNVTGSVGSVAAGGITAASIATDAIDADALAADALAEINAQVVDALATDTYAEPGQGAPAATTSLAAKIGYMYKRMRNAKEFNKTTGVKKFFADDGTTCDQKLTAADDGTTYSETEIASGP